MRRLVAFGCSFTYGHGLTDCFKPPADPGPNPSRLAWPQLIADQFGLECVNKGLPGASNKRIWHSISTFEFRHDDIVFIMWTEPERYTVLTDTSWGWDNIGQWQDTRESLLYYKFFFNEYDSDMMSKLYISDAHNYFNKLGLTCRHFMASSIHINLFNLRGIKVPHIPFYLNDEEFRKSFEPGLDDVLYPGYGHPGDRAHLEFTRLALNYLKLENGIPPQKSISKTENLKRKFKFYSFLRWITRCIRSRK